MNNWFKFLFALGCVLCEGVSAFTTGPAALTTYMDMPTLLP